MTGRSNFHPAHGLDDIRAFYQYMRARLAAVGQVPEKYAILPAVSVVLGVTEAIARERADYLKSLIDPELDCAFASSNPSADMRKVIDKPCWCGCGPIKV